MQLGQRHRKVGLRFPFAVVGALIEAAGAGKHGARAVEIAQVEFKRPGQRVNVALAPGVIDLVENQARLGQFLSCLRLALRHARQFVQAQHDVGVALRAGHARPLRSGVAVVFAGFGPVERVLFQVPHRRQDLGLAHGAAALQVQPQGLGVVGAGTIALAREVREAGQPEGHIRLAQHVTDLAVRSAGAVVGIEGGAGIAPVEFLLGAGRQSQGHFPVALGDVDFQPGQGLGPHLGFGD